MQLMLTSNSVSSHLGLRALRAQPCPTMPGSYLVVYRFIPLNKIIICQEICKLEKHLQVQRDGVSVLCNEIETLVCFSVLNVELEVYRNVLGGFPVCCGVFTVFEILSIFHLLSRPHPSPHLWAGFHYMAQAGLRLLLPYPPKCQSFKCVPPYPGIVVKIHMPTLKL